jgi:hypothetical protein
MIPKMCTFTPVEMGINLMFEDLRMQKESLD